MWQDFKTDSEEFRGQRWLTTLLLVILAAGMVAVGIKEAASGKLLAENTANPPAAGVIPARLTIPGAGFEVNLAETGLNSQGQPAGPGWLKTSSRPGEAGTAVIGLGQAGPVAALKPGDRLEITGQAGEKLAFEITAKTTLAYSVGAAGHPVTAEKELELIVVGSNGGLPGLVLSARLVATNRE